MSDGSQAAFNSKQRRELARFARLADQVRDILKVQNAILDGEVVAIDDEGHQNFKSLMSHQGHLHYAAFDLLWLNGKDLRKQPLTKRRQQLERLLPATSSVLSHTMAVPGEGKALFGAVQRLDLEGIVAKRASDPYDPKSVWFRIKNRLYSQSDNRFEPSEKMSRVSGSLRWGIRWETIARKDGMPIFGGMIPQPFATRPQARRNQRRLERTFPGALQSVRPG